MLMMKLSITFRNEIQDQEVIHFPNTVKIPHGDFKIIIFEVKFSL